MPYVPFPQNMAARAAGATSPCRIDDVQMTVNPDRHLLS
jgi:hypothetical protein